MRCGNRHPLSGLVHAMLFRWDWAGYVRASLGFVGSKSSRNRLVKGRIAGIERVTVAAAPSAMYLGRIKLHRHASDRTKVLLAVSLFADPVSSSWRACLLGSFVLFVLGRSGPHCSDCFHAIVLLLQLFACSWAWGRSLSSAAKPPAGEVRWTLGQLRLDGLVGQVHRVQYWAAALSGRPESTNSIIATALDPGEDRGA